MLSRCVGLRGVLVIGLLVAAAGCTQMVHRVDGSNYGYAARENLTLAEIKGPIESVAQSEGWTLSDIETGRFTAYREWGGGKHNISVDVVYRTDSFDIRYKDSKALGYNGSAIHHSYNDFVKTLQASIQAAISKL